MKVLIAEDDAAFRGLLKDILESWGYEVVAVNDGNEALRMLRSADAPRLTILDWSMPGTDGVEVCRTVRREISKPYTYLILLTSHQGEKDLLAGMEAGADDYLTKPLNTGELKVRLNAGRRIIDLQSQLMDVQESLAAHAADLEAANKDLEAFSYAVANDILKSLLSIGDNSKAIKDLYCKEGDEQCRTYTRRIYEKTRSLAQLIGLMLEFFRPSRKELRRETVDLTSIARQKADALQGSEPERRVAFNIQEGIDADGDKEMLGVVVGNLMENAWKHTRKRPDAVIEVGVAEVEGKRTYHVRDNGTGFDMAEAETIFSPFHRLPGTEEFAGRGIGLATVARVIRRHGGKIWAEGERDKGATFYFTLE